MCPVHTSENVYIQNWVGCFHREKLYILSLLFQASTALGSIHSNYSSLGDTSCERKKNIPASKDL